LVAERNVPETSVSFCNQLTRLCAREDFIEDNTPTGNKISGHRKCLSVTSAHQAAKQLKLRPYQFQAVHQLRERGTAARIQYCHWFRRFVREGIHV
jgi:hypothetical protein